MISFHRKSQCIADSFVCFFFHPSLEVAVFRILYVIAGMKKRFSLKVVIYDADVRGVPSVIDNLQTAVILSVSCSPLIPSAILPGLNLAEGITILRYFGDPLV